MKLIEKDALVAEIERLKADVLQKKGQCKRSGLEKIMHQIGAYNKILSFLDTLKVKDLQEEPVSEALELAATKYAQDKYMPVQTSQAFKAGAKWKKQQMIKDAIDAHCFGLQGDALFSFRLPASKYLVGSEVKVIVIKED